ncbi:MAG: guanylate kinase [bacterium]|nr:guanylate kinase [Myxococcales bacterium]MCB9542808.1 guanylate kinase [Myxococcales bacterium]MCB9553821.1 guanylate kinase [Myxococcales bacterium]
MVLLMLAAVSGTGKSTIARMLLDRQPGLRLSVSHTTRKPREGEIDGVHYHFTAPEAFKGLVADGGFAEWAEYVGHRYGTARTTIDAARAAGHDLLFDIEVQGAGQLKGAYPQAIGVFLLPPSWDALADRLRRRGTDDDATIERRLTRGREELAGAAWFDHLVINDDLERAVAEVEGIYRSALSRTAHRMARLAALRDEAAAR